MATTDDRLADEVVKALSGVPGRPLGEGYQATVSLFDTPAGPLVVKTARKRGFLSSTRIGHEHAIYRRLAGIPGIPRTFGMLGDSGLVIEYIAGESLRDRERDLSDPAQFFSRMLTTIDAMHLAGVAHCDLKRKDNTLVGPGETPFLVDFGVACLLDDRDGWLKRRWFSLMRQMDYNAWVKLCFGRNPRDLPPDVAARYHPLWLERIARWIRIPWQKITLRRARQKWGRRYK